MNSFGKVALLKEAWEIFKKNLNVILMVVAVYFVYYLGQFFVKVAFARSPLALIFSLIFTIIFLVIQIGSYNFMLRVVDGKTATIKDLYTYSNMTMKVLRNIAAIILVGAMVAGPMVLAIFLAEFLHTNIFVLGGLIYLIFGIYLAMRLMFVTYYIVDKNAGVVDSIKMSWELTRNAVINLFLLSIVFAIVNFIGALLFGIGLAITVPLTFLATALLYRKFQK